MGLQRHGQQRPAIPTLRSQRGELKVVGVAEGGAILEEDAELIGDEAEVRVIIDRCARDACDLAFLGVVGDFFSSHACAQLAASLPPSPLLPSMLHPHRTHPSWPGDRPCGVAA